MVIAIQKIAEKTNKFLGRFKKYSRIRSTVNFKWK